MAAPLARTFPALACGRFHKSKHRERKRTRQAEENPIAGVRELRTKHPRKRRATKISSETAKELQRTGSAPKRARRHEFVNCASPAVSSFARSGRKLVENGRRDFPERLRCVAVSFLITRRPRVRIWRKTRSEKDVLFRARATGICARHDYRHVITQSSCTIIPRRTPASALDAHLWWAVRLRTCSVIATPSCTAFLGGRVRVSWTLNSGQRRMLAYRTTLPHPLRSGQTHDDPSEDAMPSSHTTPEKNDEGAPSKCQQWS